MVLLIEIITGIASHKVECTNSKEHRGCVWMCPGRLKLTLSVKLAGLDCFADIFDGHWSAILMHVYTSMYVCMCVHTYIITYTYYMWYIHTYIWYMYYTHTWHTSGTSGTCMYDGTCTISYRLVLSRIIYKMNNQQNLKIIFIIQYTIPRQGTPLYTTCVTSKCVCIVYMYFPTFRTRTFASSRYCITGCDGAHRIDYM